MSKILLIEPDYKNKYPPLGLMKISYFHKNILNDYVRFTKGKLPPAMKETKWDHVYVTTLFTFEWKKTLEAIEYAKTLVDNEKDITVGGIAATILPEQFEENTGIMPVKGLLNEPGKLGIPGDECIDQMVPDYSILDDIDYVYPYRDAYFLSATKGCGNKCGFCAVQTLEPKYIPYMNIIDRIKAIDVEFGEKKDLLLMDNNVLRSPRFDDIIDDILEAGFERGATYKNPKTGKIVKRYVDFNQGLDAMFLTEDKAKRLGEIALRPARIAFDHIEDRKTYERAIKLCSKYGVTELSNYVLYNSEDFGGKGQQYRADTPEDLYDRMRITLDLRDEINERLPEEKHVSAFSFPMRYIPLTARERGYVGSQWNAKFLRGVQCMLIPTQGKGVGSRSFFYADFGENHEQFVKFLCMPEKLIAARGEFDKGNNGDVESDAYKEKKEKWDKNQKKIHEWIRLYDTLGSQKNEFIDLIGDNEFLPEKLLGISSDLQKKLYILYLTPLRVLSLLGLIDRQSPTYELVYNYLNYEFRELYLELIETLTFNNSQQRFAFKNYLLFFGKEGLSDLLRFVLETNRVTDKTFKLWNRICVDEGIGYIDFELIRIFNRFRDLKVLSKQRESEICDDIVSLNMIGVASQLNSQFKRFEKALSLSFKEETGEQLMILESEAIVQNIKNKLTLYLGNKNE